jgi:hypothetical protein
MDEELKRAIEELTETIKVYGTKGAAGDRPGPGVFDSFTKSNTAATKALQGLEFATTRLGKSIYSGQASVSSWADAVDGAGDAMSVVTKEMGLLGKTLGLVGTAVIKYFAASARQADKLYKGFQDLTRVGAGASQGIQGVRSSLRDFGLGVDDAAKLFALFEKGAQDFAILGGSVARGAKAVGSMTRGIIGDDGVLLQFKNIGENVDTIGESAIAYASLQARLGMTDERMHRQGSKALQEYIEQQNILTRVTGAQAKDQQAAQARAMNIEQFRAKNMQLIAEGRRDEAEKDMQVFKNLSALDPSGQLAEGFAVLKSGFVAPGTGLAAMVASGGEAFDVANNSMMDANQQTQAFVASMKDMTGPGGALFGLAQVGRFKEVVGLDFGALQDAVLRSPDFVKRMAEAKTDLERDKVRQDAATEAMGRFEIANMRSRDNMQDFVNMGVGPATTALAELARVVENLTSLLPGASNKAMANMSTAEGTAVGASYGALAGVTAAALAAPFTGGASLAAIPMMAAIGAAGGGGFGFMRSGQGPGNSPNGAPAAPAEGTEGEGPKQKTPGVKDTISFSGGLTGNPSNFAALEPGFRSKIEAMAQEYHMLTKGGKLNITSAARTEEDQARLAAMGYPVAQGRSRHLDGLAVDVPPAQRQELESRGLLKKYGLTGVSSSPSHIQSLAQGGIATGPRSGYQATLHGTEAVVPLPNGKTIPVEMSGMQINMDRQLGILGQQLSKMDEMIAAMRDQTSVSQRILQVSQA